MREYEFTFVVQPELSDEGVGAISKRFEEVLAANASEKLYYEDWGRRRLAYEIKNFQKGHYRVLHFLSEGAVIPDLERVARLDDSVLRFLTVQVEDDVTDIEGRRVEATKLEEEREKRAIERAERDAEEAARAVQEAERAAQEATRTAEAEAEAAKAQAESSEGDSDDEAVATPEASAEPGDEAASPDAAEEKSEA